MTEPPNGNGYKQLAAALALGLVGGAGGTYTIADDYHRDIIALRVEAARNECRLGLLWEKRDEAR